MVRIYTKYELPFAYSNNDPFYERLKQQEEYARENIESLKKAGISEMS